MTKLAGRDLRLACRCGQIEGRVKNVSPKTGQRIVCGCVDCQSYAVLIGAADILDAQGGTELYQTLPAQVEFTKGLDKLCVLRLSPKGTLRWYAGCCGTPMGNTTAQPGFQFVGLAVAGFPEPDATEAMGKLVAKVNMVPPRPGQPAPSDRGLIRVTLGILWRHFAACLGLAPRGTPYFKDGAPIVEPKVVALDERRVAQKAALDR